jgi:opacity protein-like surface antigen
MPFFEISSLFGSETNKYEDPYSSSSNKNSLTSFGGGAGLAVKLGDKVTFDMMAGYNSTSEKAKENNPNDERTVQGTIAFKLGFTVLLGSN